MHQNKNELICKIPHKDCLSVKEACGFFREVFDVSDRSFYRHHRKNLKFFSVGPRSLRIRTADLLRYIEQCSKN